MRRTISLIFYINFLYVLFGFSQSPSQNDIELVAQIENHLLALELDSAKILLSQKFNLEEQESFKSLRRIGFSDNQTYRDYLILIENINKRMKIDPQQLESFLSSFIQEPEDETEINLDYVWIKWRQVENAREGLLNVALGNKINGEFKHYISKFDSSNLNFEKARILALTNQLSLYNIEKEVEPLERLVNESEQIIRHLKDTTLLAIILYHKCNVLYWKKDLNQYIETANEAYFIDKLQKTRSPYFTININNLSAALIFSGEYNEGVLDLINEVNNDPANFATSYPRYFQFLQNLSDDSPLRTRIYEKFKVNSTPELIELLNVRSGGKLTKNEAAELAQRMAYALIVEGYKDEAIAYVGLAISNFQAAYSQDLSKTLAEYETDLVTKEKEKEILLEQEQTKFYIIIVVLVCLLFVLSLIAYYLKSNQTIRLQENNNQILAQRNAIEKKDAEKALLLKEIHHRVKNNLQVVSSLLDLQSRDIEDEKALSTFMEGQTRVKAMALIHQKLYQNENLATINFIEYAEQLMKELATIYPSAKGVKTNIDAGQHAQFDIDTAIPLGLILNELISNAYKYAFEGIDCGELSISIESLGDGKHQLIVADNGGGLPKEFDFIKAKSLGLRLVRRLAKQLYGSVDYSDKDGARFIISFSDTQLRKTV